MAINLPSFLGYGPRDTAFGTALSHADRAAKSAYAPQQEQQALQKEQLMNAFQSMRNQYAPKQFEQEEEQRGLANLFSQARAPYADEYAKNDAMPKVGDLGQMLRDMEMVKQQFGEGSPQAQAAEEFIKTKITPKQGQVLTVDPTTGAVTFSQGGSVPASGGKGSGQPIVGPNGERLNAPTSTITNKIQSMQLAKAATDVLSQFKLPYIGKGSISKLSKDVDNYIQTKNPEIGEKLINAALINKLASERTLSSLNLLDASGTVPALKKQLSAIMQGAPETLNYVSNNLPEELSMKVNEKFDNVLEDMYQEQMNTYNRFFPSKTSDLNKENPFNQNAVNNQQVDNAERTFTRLPKELGVSDQDIISFSEKHGDPVEVVVKKIQESLNKKKR